MLGDQRRDDIDLVVAGDGDKGVHVGNAFDGQQVVVGAVALDDQHVFKPVGDFPGLFGAALDELDFAVGRDRLRDELPGQATAEDHDIFEAVLDMSGQFDHVGDVGGVANDENPVIEV